MSGVYTRIYRRVQYCFSVAVKKLILTHDVDVDARASGRVVGVSERQSVRVLVRELLSLADPLQAPGGVGPIVSISIE